MCRNLIMLVEINVCFLLYLHVLELLHKSTDDSGSDCIARTTDMDFCQDMAFFIAVPSFYKNTKWS